MSSREQHDSIIKQVKSLPAQEQLSLAQEITQMARKRELPPPPRKTFVSALGIGRGKGSPPTDRQVREIIHEHRMSK
jgi:hypothetical protein